MLVAKKLFSGVNNIAGKFFSGVDDTSDKTVLTKPACLDLKMKSKQRFNLLYNSKVYSSKLLTRCSAYFPFSTLEPHLLAGFPITIRSPSSVV